MNEKNENFARAGDFLKGHLKFAILKALEKKPLHGYAIIKRIEELTTVWKPTTGSIYPMLAHMEKEKLVTAKSRKETGRKIKVYRIAKKGKAKLQAQQRVIEPMLANLHRVFKKLLPKEHRNSDYLLEIVSKKGFLKKEIMKMQQNMLVFVILQAKGKTKKIDKEKIKNKIKELNSLLDSILQTKE